MNELLICFILTMLLLFLIMNMTNEPYESSNPESTTPQKIKDFLIGLNADKLTYNEDKNTLFYHSLNNYIIAKNNTGDDFIATLASLYFVYRKTYYKNIPLSLDDTRISNEFGKEADRLLRLYGYIKTKYPNRSGIARDEYDQLLTDKEVYILGWIEYANIVSHGRIDRWPDGEKYLKSLKKKLNI